MENKILKMRIPKELQQLEKTKSQHGISCIIDPGNDNTSNTQLIATIPGPCGSAYEAGIFKVSVSFGAQYPFRPPTFKFITPVFHPNIDNSGKICLDLLRMPPNGSYNPAITLESILLSIQLLLATPNPDDPLQHDAAELFKTNREEFNRQAAQSVRKHCGSEPATATPNEDVQTDVVAKKKAKLNL